MKILLIVLNLLAAILIVPASYIVHDEYSFLGMSMYVALDRAEIINREKLTEIYPDQMKNDQALIPKLFFQKKHPVLMLSVPCAIGFILNALLIGIFWKKKPNQTVEPTRETRVAHG